MGNKLLNFSPLGQLDEADDFEALLAVLLAKKNLFQVGDPGELHHYGNDVGAEDGLVIFTGLDQGWHLMYTILECFFYTYFCDFHSLLVGHASNHDVD